LVLDESGFVETLPDGTSCRWGSVLSWEPPAHLAMTWHPGHGPDPHTRLDVSFEDAPGGTLVRLVHTGWENLGLTGMEALGDYTEGWDVVLGAYVNSVAVGV
jgi:uncharacterized protein YndB with AHSA1/START domain